MAPSTMLVVSKHDNTKCVSVEIAETQTLPELAPSSVRVRTKLISLTSNNLSYARGGFILHWWDAYPVPPQVPDPYNNRDDWGIVAAWGYGEIIESNVKGLKPGTELFGFWPMSSLPVDLKLVRFEAPKSHWREISDHRQRLMSLYNRYMEVADGPKSSSSQAAESVSVSGAAATADRNRQLRGWTSVLAPLFGAALQLNRYVFPGALDAPPSLALDPQHPSGSGLPWTQDDADLKSAVFISLSAATKTARGFASQMLYNRNVKDHGPRGFLQVTRDISALEDGSASEYLSSHCSSKLCSYAELDTSVTLAWMSDLKPSRIVMVDFGAPAGTAERIVQAITTESAALFRVRPSITLIGLGNEMRVLSDDEIKQKQLSAESLGRIQFNSSTLRERGIELEGADAYFVNLDKAFADWIQRGENPGEIGNLQLSWASGFDGPDGIKATWEALCCSALAPEKACVFRL